MAAHKRIYRFGPAETQGDASMGTLLGGKGANLAEMAKLGLPVPPGFTITTEVCNAYAGYGETEPGKKLQSAFVDALMAEVLDQDVWLAGQFGFAPLVSVRSGAPVSMPGMMDTILNVGLGLDTIIEWEKRIGQRAAWDSYRRLIQMLGATAFGVDPAKFEFQLASIKKQNKLEHDHQLDVWHLQQLVNRYKIVFEQTAQKPFPETRTEQLRAAVMAVFRSWMNPRAIEYRKINKIPADMGTAVNVQAMVFGNMGPDSGTGVLFSRDPSTGEKTVLAEFLPNAQGEDVVAGIRTPLPLSDMKKTGDFMWESVHSELMLLTEKLEAHYRDMMDIEFTVQKGKLWLLQCRRGKRSALAAFEIGYQLHLEGVLTPAEVISRLSVEQYKLVRRPRIADGFTTPAHATGIGASPGVVTGMPVFSAEEAVASEVPCILVTHETNPEDIAGMAAAVGILTRTGGSTSHAAVVARSMDKPCVVGCIELSNDEIAWSVAGGPAFDGSSVLTIDGNTGRVWIDVDVPMVDSSDDPAVVGVCELALGLAGMAAAVSELPNPAAGPARVMCAHWWGDTGMTKKVLSQLAEQPSLGSIVLDLTPPSRFRTSPDAVLEFAFKDEASALEEEQKFYLDVLDLLRTDKVSTMLQGLTLTAEEALPADLKTRGYKLASVATTVADLIFNDAVELTDWFVETVVGGQKALSALLSALNKDQHAMHYLPSSAPPEHVVFKALATPTVTPG